MPGQSLERCPLMKPEQMLGSGGVGFPKPWSRREEQDCLLTFMTERCAEKNCLLQGKQEGLKNALHEFPCDLLLPSRSSGELERGKPRIRCLNLWYFLS